ncbi:MAG: LLM class flavin-dependent oxidoreductase [Deltaproteobacteria bacterium]|nr:LLM class flavin-dependent oxidoreductase [Deltaproteobacteria bacterium]
MPPLSILDLCSITEGSGAREAYARSVTLAQRAEALGYRRFWLAEHHNMPGIASAATSLVIAHVAAATKTIRVGAGGIMLPNHAPLIIAEQFGTLATLYPGRIDLGVGRAPGTDQATAYALRRNLSGDVDQFPRDVIELMQYFRPEPGQRVNAVPAAGLDVPVWILGSSLFGAQLAAALGLPFAFASHFAPTLLDEALAIYRHRFEPSETLEKPYVMAALGVIAADTDDEAQLLATSLQQTFIALRRGTPGPLPKPKRDLALTPADRAMLDGAFACSIAGGEETVRRGLHAFAERTKADELIVTSHIWDDAARLRSLEITARAAST